MSSGPSGIQLAWAETMKSGYGRYRGAALIACCLLGACRVVNLGSPASDSGGNGESGSLAAAGSTPVDGSTAAGGKHAGGAPAAGAPSDDSSGAGQAAGGEAGESGEAGDADLAPGGAAGSSDGGTGPQSTPLDPATAECNSDGGCTAKCLSESATCAIEFPPGNCEFDVFRDAQRPMTCGQTVTVGIADCGECGSVAVELYYDGTYCWQGFPDCIQSVFSGKFLDPHAPLP